MFLVLNLIFNFHSLCGSLPLAPGVSLDMEVKEDPRLSRFLNSLSKNLEFQELKIEMISTLHMCSVENADCGY